MSAAGRLVLARGLVRLLRLGFGLRATWVRRRIFDFRLGWARRTTRRRGRADRLRFATRRGLAARLVALRAARRARGRDRGRRRAGFEAFFVAFFRAARRFWAIFLNLSAGRVDLGR